MPKPTYEQLEVRVQEQQAVISALRQRERRYRSLFTYLDEGVCLFERLPLRPDGLRDYRYIAMNPAMQVMFGIPDLSGQSIRDNFPDEVEDWFDDYDRVLETGQSVRIRRESVPQGMVLEMFVARVEDDSGNQLLAVMRNITERVAAEKRMAESERNFRGFFDNALVGAAQLDGSGRFRRVNHRLCELLGYSAAELEGRRGLLDLTPAEEVGADPDRVARLLAGEPYDAQMRTVRKNGEAIWLHVTASPVRDESGWLQFIAAVVEDITAHKIAEERLALSEERLRLATEGAQVGIWNWDVATGRVEWSELCRSHFGLPPGVEPTMERFYAALHPDDRERVAHLLEQSVEGGPDYFAEYRVVRADGTVRWISAAGRGYRNPDGSLRGLAGLTLDVTAQKEAGAELERMRVLMAEGEQLAGLGIWEYDVATQATVWSAEECRIYGFDPEQKSPDYGRLLRECIHPEDVAELDRAFNEAMASRGTFSLEHRIVRPDGVVRVVRDLGHPYLDAAGNLVRYVGTTIDVTEAKAAADALARSTEQLRLATEGAGIGLWSWSLIDNRFEWDERFRALLGLQPGEAPSLERFYAAVHPEDRARVERLVAEAVERRSEYTAEYRVVGPEGAVRWLSAPGKVYVNADGSLRAMSGIAIDITSRVAMELEIRALNQSLEQRVAARTTELRDALARLQLARDAAEIGIWTWDLEKNRLEWDERLLEWFEPPAEVRAAGAYFDFWAARVHPEDRAHCEVALAESIATPGRSAEVSFRFVRQDGVIRHIHAAWVIERDTHGKALRVTGVNRDVTERTLAEAALRQERRRLEDIVAGTRAGTWEWNVQTSELLLNDRSFEIIGYTAADFAPLSLAKWQTVIHPDDLAQVYASVEQQVRGERSFLDVELRERHKDGHWVWVLTRGRIVSWTDEGKPLLMAGTHLDITELKNIESELALAKERAEAANQAKSVFLSAMSHEMRTPLNAMIGLADVFLERELPLRQQRDYIGRIAVASKGLLIVLNEILDHAKVESGQLTLESEPLSLAQLVGECDALYGIAAAAKGVQLHFSLSPDLPEMLSGDPLRLRQVLANLVSNAVKFTDSGGVEVVVEPAEARADSVLVRFTVRDTGIGLSTVQLSGLFAPFQQADSSISRRFGGTGLGLSISKRLAELMGGQIGVESTLGRGSTFWFTARLDRSGGPAPQRPARVARAGSAVVPAPTVEVSAPGTPVDVAALLPRLQELTSLLGQGQLKARNCSADIEKLLAGTEAASGFGRVSRAVEEFDYRKALGHLQALAREQHWELS